MKKLLLSFFALSFFIAAFAAPKRYKLLSSTTNWFNTANWLPAGLPANGGTVTIPANVQLDLSYDLTLQNVYFDLYGSIVLSGNNMKMILQNTSTLNVHTSGWIDGSKASQQIVMGNNSIYKGKDGLVTGALIATSLSNGFVPYIENQILPVKFIAFTVTRSNAGFQVQWTAAEEKSTAHYEVQRSENGNVWKSIATVFAAGNNTNTYTYADKTAAANAVYYRIKQVDKSGSVTYTAVCLLKSGDASLPVISAFQNKITMRFAQPVSGNVMIEVIRLNGSVAKTQTVAAPSGTLQLATSNLHGIYIVRVHGQKLNSAQQLFL